MSNLSLFPGALGFPPSTLQKIGRHRDQIFYSRYLLHTIGILESNGARREFQLPTVLQGTVDFTPNDIVSNGEEIFFSSGTEHGFGRVPENLGYFEYLYDPTGLGKCVSHPITSPWMPGGDCG